MGGAGASVRSSAPLQDARGRALPFRVSRLDSGSFSQAWRLSDGGLGPGPQGVCLSPGSAQSPVLPPRQVSGTISVHTWEWGSGSGSWRLLLDSAKRRPGPEGP